MGGIMRLLELPTAPCAMGRMARLAQAGAAKFDARARTALATARARARGQGTTEYAILVGVLVVIAILAITLFRPKIQELWNAIAEGINSL